MLSLDNVLLLEQKVNAVVSRVRVLEGENASLTSRCRELEALLKEKSDSYDAMSAQESKIEETIASALTQLDGISVPDAEGEPPAASAVEGSDAAQAAGGGGAPTPPEEGGEASRDPLEALSSMENARMADADDAGEQGDAVQDATVASPPSDGETSGNDTNAAGAEQFNVFE